MRMRYCDRLVSFTSIIGWKSCSQASVLTICLLIAIVLNGLMAGLFFAFSIAIIPGFRRVDDGTYIRSFRAINTAILNPVFLLVFSLAPLSAVATAVVRPWAGGSEPVPWLVIELRDAEL